MTNANDTGKAPRASYGLDEHQAAPLGRLADRRPARHAAAAAGPGAGRGARGRLPPGPPALPEPPADPPAEEPEDRAEDVADALSLLRAAREDLKGLEAALLLAARQPGTRAGKPLLTFRQIAAAIGAGSEQGAQGRYRRKVGSPRAGRGG